MSDKAVLVRESWARRVTSAIQTQEADALNASAAGKPTFAESRFYDIRPARLQSNWTQNSAGVYQATAAFITNDAGDVDSSFLFPVYSIPGFTPSGTVDETIFFVVWRGRWEALPTGGDGAVVAPFSLYTNWVSQGSGLYKATAKQIIADNGATDPTPVDVFAIVTAGVPAGTAGAWKFWATWRNDRWETLQPVFPSSSNYVGGVGIDVGAFDSVLGGRPITNMGVRSVVIPGSGYEARADALYLASNHFKWRDSTTTTGKEVCLKTRRLNVVTNIVNGSPVRETIEVIGVD